MRMPPHSHPYNRAGHDQALILQSTAWPGPDTGSPAGLPAERAARIAARQAFVQLKRCFMDAAGLVPGSMGELLRRKIRGAHEPLDLWHLREVLLALLPCEDEAPAATVTPGTHHTPDSQPDALQRRLATCREELQQQIERVFVDSITGTTRDF